VGRKIRLKESLLRNVVRKLITENIKRSSIEMAPLAPGARNYTRIIKKVRDVGESTQNRKFFHAVVDSQRTIEKIFKDLLIRELGNDLYSQLERWLKSFGRVLSTASELGRDIDYDLPIEIMANNVGFTPEKLSNTLASAAQRIAPDIAEALESQASMLQKLLGGKSNPDSMGSSTFNATEPFPSIARQIMSSEHSTEADIERFAKAPPDAPLGRIAFSPERMKRERIPYEPNTDIENALKKDVLSYVHDNVDFEPESIRLIKQLVAQGYYGDVIRFTDPSIGTVYRGLAIEADAIPDEFGSELSNRMSGLKLGDIVTFDVSLTYRPWNRSGISSWSTVPSIGVDFASDSSLGREGKVYMMVFHAQIADNSDSFLDAFNLFNKIDVTDPQLLAQREQFGIGNIKVSKVTVAAIDADDFGSGRAIVPSMKVAVRLTSMTGG
jgi:hypothetical protein